MYASFFPVSGLLSLYLLKIFKEAKAKSAVLRMRELNAAEAPPVSQRRNLSISQLILIQAFLVLFGTTAKALNEVALAFAPRSVFLALDAGLLVVLRPICMFVPQLTGVFFYLAMNGDFRKVFLNTLTCGRVTTSDGDSSAAA